MRNDIELRVYDILGSAVKTTKRVSAPNMKFALDLGDQPGGMYLLEMNVDGNIHVKRIIIQR